MMSQERGSGALSVGTAVLIMVGMSMVFHCDVVSAKDYTVNWGFKWTSNLPKGHRCKVGDTIAFNYDPKFHNLVKGAKGGCTAKSSVYPSGSKIKLEKGNHYFICSIGNHCAGGMKMAVTAN
ncbi:hypothetical protein OROGR_031309 [Orobanche gracilis]